LTKFFLRLERSATRIGDLEPDNGERDARHLMIAASKQLSFDQLAQHRKCETAALECRPGGAIRASGQEFQHGALGGDRRHRLLFAGWSSYGWNGSGNARSIRSDAQAIPHAKARAPGCSEWMRVRGELSRALFS
jgi:hypothetical protein